MIDLKQLEYLAKNAKDNGGPFYGVPYQKATNPAAILELIETQRMLVEALRAIVNEIPSSVEYSDWPEMQGFVREANQAIQKATGKSS